MSIEPSAPAQYSVLSTHHSKHVIATVDEIPPGQRKIVDVAGRSIGVFNIGGEFFAIRNRCPHQGGPLCQGRVAGLVSSSSPGEYSYTRPGEVIRCPWHGWEYDIKTGQSWYDPRNVRVRAYEVTVTPGSDLEAALEERPLFAGERAMPADRADGFVKGPYVAETYPVSVEKRRPEGVRCTQGSGQRPRTEQYVVVEVPG